MYDLNKWKDLTEFQRNYACINQKLTQSFINKHWEELTNLQRDYVYKYQKLTQTFISKHWKELTEFQRIDVCEYQKLTQPFITKHWEESTEWQRDYVYKYQKLTQSFINKHWEDLTEFHRNRTTQIHKNYPTKTERIKRAKEYAKQHGLKIKGKWLYAFRNHDERGCGMWNKTIFYSKGKLYRDWHCDPRVGVENSFGLGIWPKGNTPVRVPLGSFVVAVSRHDGKARVEAFEVV